MKTTVILTCVALVISLLSASFPVNGEVKIYDNVVRLHVLANSDEEEDQQLKLLVRDAVLECMNENINKCLSVEEAKKSVNENIEAITSAAKKCIEKNGYNYKVLVETGVEKYPTRNYENVSFPAGEYYSVKVKIGKAEGKNWWCVLFPPLCVGVATASTAEDELTSVGLTTDEVKILTENDGGEYELKFKLLEFFQKTFA